MRIQIGDGQDRWIGGVQGLGIGIATGQAPDSDTERDIEGLVDQHGRSGGAHTDPD